MNLNEKIESTAPCGLDCFNCPSHEQNITKEQIETLAAYFYKDKSEIPCKGCRSIKGQCMFTGDCPSYKCAIEKGVIYCFECDEFPCQKLAPASQNADKFPHNYKLYNLCRMQKIGVEEWIIKEADKIRKAYFTGNFKPGHGVTDNK